MSPCMNDFCYTLTAPCERDFQGMSTSVYIETFGCQMNVSDSERAARGLRKAGYELVGSADGADVVLFNTCSVRERAEQRVYNRIGELRKAAPEKFPLIGVMGC